MVRLVCYEQEINVTVEKAEALLHVISEMRLDSWRLPVDSPYKLVNGKIIESGSTEAIPRKTSKKRG
jgi:hypothetical protein